MVKVLRESRLDLWLSHNCLSGEQTQMVLIQPVKRHSYEGDQTVMRTLWLCPACDTTIEARQVVVTSDRIKVHSD